jgi:hypothetical protein
LNHDIIDLKSHNYLVYKSEKLKKVLGVDVIAGKHLWKYLRRWCVVVSRPKGLEVIGNQDIEMERIGMRMR